MTAAERTLLIAIAKRLKLTPVRWESVVETKSLGSLEKAIKAVEEEDDSDGIDTFA